MPKTAVGKVFKPDLRKLAITRVLNAALSEAGWTRVVDVVTEDKKRGLVAQIRPAPVRQLRRNIAALMDRYAPWDAK